LKSNVLKTVDIFKYKQLKQQNLACCSGGQHSFMSFSKIFQLCTHARITKCGSHET